MSSLNTLTGRLGDFMYAGVFLLRTTKWDVSPSLAHTSEWGDSEGGGHTNRAAGRDDCKFTAEGKYDTTAPIYDAFYPGDVGEAKLYIDKTSSSLFWLFPRALCLDFKMEINVDTEEVLGYTSSWAEDGKSYYPGEAFP